MRQTLQEWDAVVEKQREVEPGYARHAHELVEALERAERRLGKDLRSFKRALREP